MAFYSRPLPQKNCRCAARVDAVRCAMGTVTQLAEAPDERTRVLGADVMAIGTRMVGGQTGPVHGVLLVYRMRDGGVVHDYLGGPVTVDEMVGVLTRAAGRFDRGEW